jgi:hypothetical protein
MSSLFENEAFKTDFELMKQVSLNPTKHLAANVWEHITMVRDRVHHLAELNGCSDDEKDLLDNLALVHDMGKIDGTANPDTSVELLDRYGLFPDSFKNLVKYHDCNLAWFLSAQRGEPPSEKAWAPRSLNIR